MEPNKPCVPVRAQCLELPVEAHDAWPLQEEAAQVVAGDDALLVLAAEAVADCNRKRRESAVEASERHEWRWEETEELTITGEEVAAQCRVLDKAAQLQQLCKHQAPVELEAIATANIKCSTIEQAERQRIRDEQSIRQRKPSENMGRLFVKEEEQLRLEQEEVERIQKADEVWLRQVYAEKEWKQREETEPRALEKADIVRKTAENCCTLEEEKEVREMQQVQCQRRPFLECCWQQDDELEKEKGYLINNKKEKEQRKRAKAQAEVEKRAREQKDKLDEKRRGFARAFAKEEEFFAQEVWKQRKERKVPLRVMKKQASTGAAGRRGSAERDCSGLQRVRSSKEEQRGRRRSAIRKTELDGKQRKKNDKIERRSATREEEFDAKQRTKDTAQRARRRCEQAPHFETGERRMVRQAMQNSPRAVKRARSHVAEEAHLHKGGACDSQCVGCCGGQPSFVAHPPSEHGACCGGCCPGLSDLEISGSMGKAILSLMDPSINATLANPMATLPEAAGCSPLASHAGSPYGRSEESPPLETRVWLPSAAISSRPQFLKEDEKLPAEDNVPENPCRESRCSARIWLEEMEWRMRTRSGGLLQAARRWGWACMPLRFQALVSSAARETSMAARVHKGATVAVVIPRGMALPTEAELKRHSLRHSMGVRGWAALADGSALGVLQLTTQEGAHRGRKCLGGLRGVMHVGWVNHGQAKALSHAQIQIMKLLGSRMPAWKQAELRNALRTDELPSQVLPGVRMWPLHDPLVSRIFWLNISLERCRSCKNCLRLDRGPRFLDLSRLHYGEEVAFLFAWHSHYIYVLAAFVAVTVPLIVWRTYKGTGHIDHWMLPHSLLTIIFGVALTELWKPKAKRLVHRWHAHVDCTSRWQQIVLHLMASRAACSPPRALQSDPGSPSCSEQTSPWTSETCSPRSICIDHFSTTEGAPEVPVEGGAEGSMGPGAGGRVLSEDSQCSLQCIAPHEEEEDVPRTTAQRRFCLKNTTDTFGIPTSQYALKRRLFRLSVSHEELKRILKSTLILPILILEWVVILVFFSFIAWFEIWVIFDWGGCREYNMQFDDDDWRCLSADQLRGPSGVLMGALPSIAEGICFELLLAISKVTAHAIIKLYHFRTREQHDFAVVTIVFLLEVIGKVGFILVLGLGFVPVWSSQNWTSCRRNWDYFVMGDWSLGCLKGQIPFQVRLKLFESIMKGPMWIAGIASISAKTLVPLVLQHWRRLRQGPTYDEDGCGCRLHSLAGFLLAPLDFPLRFAMLILQTDSGAVGGLHFLCRWPPTLAKHQQSEEPTRKDFKNQYSGYSSTGTEVSSHKQEYADKITKARRAWLRSVLLEGERREHEPFDEYMEMLLHFLWTSCFAIVWPLGCIFSLLIQILEFRSDCLKLLAIRRRRFPRTRHMSVAWVPRFANIVCHISILVNIALLLLSYRQLLIWLPDSCKHTNDGDGSFLTACERMEIVGAFLSTWACFLVVHFLAKRVVYWLPMRLGHCCARRTPNHSRISKADAKSPEFSQLLPTPGQRP